MSPPSSMETSSESDSEMPLSKRLQKEEKDKKTNIVKRKKKTMDENQIKNYKKDQKPPARTKCSNVGKKAVAKLKSLKTKDLTIKNKNKGVKAKVKRRKKAI